MNNKTKSVWHQIDSLLRQQILIRRTTTNGQYLYEGGQICGYWNMVAFLLHRELRAVNTVLVAMIKANPKVYAHASSKPKEDIYADGDWFRKRGSDVNYQWAVYAVKHYPIRVGRWDFPEEGEF